jgi:hypothetical protein
VVSVVAAWVVTVVESSSVYDAVPVVVVSVVPYAALSYPVSPVGAWSQPMLSIWSFAMFR